MKNIFLRFVKWSLSILGLSLGCYALTGCVRVEYGVPHANFQVKGKVIDSKTKEGLRGISVTMNPAGYQQVNGQESVSKYYYDSTVVNVNGEFELWAQEMTSGNIYLKVKDIDPYTYGNYLEKTVKVQFQQTEEGSGSWYEGTYSSDILIELKEIGSEE